MKKIFLFLLGFIAFGFFACQEEVEVEVGETAVIEVSGNWFVQIYDDAGNVLDYWVEAYTYNTSNNSKDSLWVWVDEGWNYNWDVQCKVGCDVEAKTFSGTEVENIIDETIWSIEDGQIFPDQGKTIGGHVTDSIYFTINDGVDTYTVAGHEYTGFTEDDPRIPEQ